MQLKLWKVRAGKLYVRPYKECERQAVYQCQVFNPSDGAGHQGHVMRLTKIPRQRG